MKDHVHILSTLSRTRQAAEMIKEVKRSSSIWIKTKDPRLEQFAWQSGYGIFSIGFSQLATVRRYIAGQEEHHRQLSFQDELRLLLSRFDIEFDERYVWDRFNPFRVAAFDRCSLTQGSRCATTLG